MITLQRPSEELSSSYLGFIEEMRQLGEKVWEGTFPARGESDTQFVCRLLEAETKPLPGKIAETTFWACEDGVVVGRINLRHDLNDNLREFGGHVGYEVRPSRRNRGVAKEMLRLILQSTEAKKIGRILLTCAPDNIPSNKTILANGGHLFQTAWVEKWKRDTNYYWITVQ